MRRSASSRRARRVPVEVLRDGQTVTLQVTLGTRPANP